MKNKDSNLTLGKPDWMNELDASPLEQNVFHALKKAVKQYKKYAQNQFDQKVGDLTVDQFMILSFIERNPNLNQSQIATLVFKDKASVTRMIELIRKKGYLKREINENDRRKYLLKLTPKAKQKLFELRKIRSRNRAVALDGISAEQISQLIITLEKLISNCLTE